MDGRLIPSLTLMNRNGQTLFEYDDVRYIVPFYQRAFAWGEDRYSARENEIVQLMDDIYDADGEYYLGSLVVYERKAGEYEVIDGQQRLTALYILFKCLGLDLGSDCALTYDCRDRSNRALANIDKIRACEIDDLYENSICNAVATVEKRLRELSAESIDGIQVGFDAVKQRMLNAFARTRLFRIEVPPRTDLNRYFEVMNTRGEQLEQQDIVKANLMQVLTDAERSLFAEIWDACSDMTGYVQMHFAPKVRTVLFDWNWQSLPTRRCFKQALAWRGRQEGTLTLDAVLGTNEKFSSAVTDEREIRVRFDSIIDFPNFLLHVLRVFRKKVLHENTVEGLIDDRRLIIEFADLLKTEKPEETVFRFMCCLLQCRFLFDKYIIKREYRGSNSDGEWSLKELRTSGSCAEEDGDDRVASLRPYYVETEFKEFREWSSTANPRKAYNKMLQACLRVSYTSPRVMHWITKGIAFLYDVEVNNGRERISGYGNCLEDIAKKECRRYLMKGDYALGVGTPHLVLNYLDFLLWQEDREKYSDFDFEFRNSVEHWYPQNPSEGTFDRWEGEGVDTVDRFGNLCLISRRTNSKFSNLSPESKYREYRDLVEHGSLKLRKMARITQCHGSESWRMRKDGWNSSLCHKHEYEMLNILREASGFDLEN